MGVFPDMTNLERLGLEVVAFQLIGSRSQAAMLCALIDARGAVMEWDALSRARPWRMQMEETTANVIKVRMSHLRNAMDDLGLGGLIVTAGRKEGIAYSLPEPGRSKVLARLISEAA